MGHAAHEFFNVFHFRTFPIQCFSWDRANTGRHEGCHMTIPVRRQPHAINPIWIRSIAHD